MMSLEALQTEKTLVIMLLLRVDQNLPVPALQSKKRKVEETEF